MKKNLMFFLPFLWLILTGCSSDEVILLEGQKKESTFYSIEEIIERAKQYHSIISENTRSEFPNVSSVIPLTSASRSLDDNTPVYYIVNFEDNGGFAIVGGNEVAEPLLAVSDESNVTMEMVHEIPGLQEFVTTTMSLKASIDTLSYDHVPYNISILPKLNVNVRTWGQGAPFNSYTPVIDNQHAVVGCVPLATAMMMSYYEWPQEHNGRKINWSQLKKGYVDELGVLLTELGNPENLNVRYGVRASSASYVNIRPTMYNYSYRLEAPSIDLKDIYLNPTEESKQEIEEELPLLMSGWTKDGAGHCWVIDGLLHIPYDPDNKVNPNNNPDKYFFHCVWGWNGRANGYYLHDGLGSIGGERHTKDGSDKLYPGYSDQDNPYIFSDWVWGYYGFKKRFILVGGEGPIVRPVVP